LLNPIKANSFVFESPRTNECERFVEKRIDGPQEESAVVGREVRNGQRGERFEIQAIIV